MQRDGSERKGQRSSSTYATTASSSPPALSPSPDAQRISLQMDCPYAQHGCQWHAPIGNVQAMTEHSTICLAPTLAQLRVDHAAQAQRVQRLQQQLQQHVATISSQKEELTRQRQQIWDADARVLVKVEANLTAAEAAEAVPAVASAPPSPPARMMSSRPPDAASPVRPSSARRSTPPGSVAAAALSTAAASASAVAAAAMADHSHASVLKPSDAADPTRFKRSSASVAHHAPVPAEAAPAPAPARPRPVATPPSAKRRKHAQTVAVERREEEGEEKQRELHGASASAPSSAAAAAAAAASNGASHPSPITSRFGRIRVPFHKDAEYIAAISKPPAAAAAAAASRPAAAPSSHFHVCKPPAASPLAPVRLGGVDHAVYMINGHHWFDWNELHGTLVRIGLLTVHPPADESLHLRSSSGAMQWLEYYEHHFFPARSRWAHTKFHEYSVHGYAYGKNFSKDVCVSPAGLPFLCVHGLAGIALMDHASDEELQRLKPRIEECTAAFEHVLTADKEVILAENAQKEAEAARKAAKTGRKAGAPAAASTAAPVAATAATSAAFAGPPQASSTASPAAD